MMNFRHEGVFLEGEGKVLSVLIANAKSGSRQCPFHRIFFAHYPATPAFQAAFEGKCDAVISELETVCWAHI